MPVGVGIQNYDNWPKEFNKLDINENTVIIAHSIAPIFVCKYLITNKINVKKLIFVSGFNNYLGINEEFDFVNKPMFIERFAEVRNFCKVIVCYYSNNDPYVKYEVQKEFADTISNKQYVIKGDLSVIPILVWPCLLFINDCYGVYNWKKLKKIQEETK